MISVFVFLLALTGLAAPQGPRAAPPGMADYTGRVQSGVTAIGGETTGILIVTDKERFELAADGAMRTRLSALNGQQVTVRGRLTVRQGVERGTRRIITVTRISAPAPMVQRERGILIYQALGRRTDPASAAAIATLPPPIQAELNRRMTITGKGFSPTINVSAGARGTDADMDRTRRELEIALATFAATPQAWPEAGEYARSAKMYYEWEGDPSGPMDEVQFVASYIADNRTSPLRGYLELFALHRARAAFEAAGSGAMLTDPARQASLQREAAGLYNSIWTRLQQSTDPVVKALAADIDAKPFVYIDIALHPRRPEGVTRGTEVDLWKTLPAMSPGPEFSTDRTPSLSSLCF